MDWTSAFAVIGALIVILGTCVFAAVVGVLAWIGGRHILDLYRDDQRAINAIHNMKIPGVREDM